MRALLLYPYLPHPGVSHGSGRVVEGLIRALACAEPASRRPEITLVCGDGTPADVAATRLTVAALHVAPRVDVGALSPPARVAEMARTAWLEKVHGIPRFAAKMVRESFRRAVADALRDGPYDIIQAEIGGLAEVVDLLPHDVPTILVDHEAGTATGRSVLDEPHTLAWVKRRYVGWKHLVALTPEDAASLGRVLDRDVSVRPVGVEVPKLAEVVSPMTVLFFGSASHVPNMDAIDWLARDIWPRVRAKLGEARLRIATGEVPLNLRAEMDRTGVEYLGYVKDIHRLIASSAVVVAPLRLGHGIRIKNLETLAMGRPLVTTSLGARGTGVVDGLHARIADTGADLATAIEDLLRNPSVAEAMGSRARSLGTIRFSNKAAADWTLEMWSRIVDSR